MIKCSQCGAANAPDSFFCGDCGEPLSPAPESEAGRDPKNTDPSDRIVISRDTQGEVSVKVVRPEGR